MSQINLDSVDYEIMHELLVDGRQTTQKISEKVHMTRPAVKARIMKMEDAGIIKGYAAILDLKKIGKVWRAFIMFEFNTKAQAGNLTLTEKMRKILAEAKDVVVCYYECYGSIDAMIYVASPTKFALDGLLEDLNKIGVTRTCMIQSAKFNLPVRGHGADEKGMKF